MKNVLIVGAGRLGKGFVGETFFNANWNIAFLDKDPEVIEKLQETGQYKVKVHKTDDVVENIVSGYKAYLTDEDYSVMDSFLESELIMLPLYPKDFKEAADYLSKCFNQQFKQNPESKKTLICLTNKNHIIDQITGYFREALQDEETKAWFDKNVVVRDSIVRRSTDAESNTSTELITTAVASLLIQKPVHCDFSDVKWLELRDKIEMLKDIKVFTINGPHAATAFYGYLKDYKLIPEAEKDEDISELIKGVHDTTVAAVMKEYPVTRDEIRELEYLPAAKNEMPDSVFRVAFDPIRKVSPRDRFMGVVDLCKKHELSYEPIAQAIACGFGYSEERDPKAVILQKTIAEKGIEKSVSQYIGEPADSDVVKHVVAQYEKMKTGGLIK